MNKVYKLIKNKIFFGIIITFYFRQYLKVSINSLKGISEEEQEDVASEIKLRILETSNKGSKELFIAMSMTLCFGISPVLLWAFLVFYKQKLQCTEFTLTWGAFYSNL